ncbi:hypothetical protein [Roseibium marinum]|uniref:Uncharacterized protein n=1 Tax=Roseibium marinum TaxID=281252 RepID=A0A2S3ULJ8_9HYPH|nr:hypothetical protein [Roseibium marinum]POF28433.1 hypothetical protein CLV41_114104 [Roseibium marinum]
MTAKHEGERQAAVESPRNPYENTTAIGSRSRHTLSRETGTRDRKKRL